MSTDCRIIMFGAGAIGQVTTPEILRDLDLLSFVDCYLDNNAAMWGTFIEACGESFEVKPPTYLESCRTNNVILLNISRFPDVLRQLDGMSCTKDMTCFVMPMMLIHNFCSRESQGNVQLSDEPLIPKKIHYMWLGRNALPDSLKKCIESWKRYCPDYEIIEWNEDNYDIKKHPYMDQAYNARAFGYVPDYARIDILYNHGGFYLDTDVELKKNIDNLRFQRAFCGVEKWQIINFGGLSGSVKGNPMIKEFLDAREEIFFLNDDGTQNRNTCGFYDTRVALSHGYKINGESQAVGDINIYAYDYFQPYDYMSGIINETRNTYSVHWFNGGWMDEQMKKANEEAMKIYKKMYTRALDCEGADK
ncbi:glycosyltransferase family 32 protein [Butyrivibrio sp. NC2007]|uniref:glycosyltransferase family 32 protein n=1 Tax=Butyrivibrio sp. NC2007 TaxID=1280683 RepID=UPI001FA7B750|nr:glycosyltransferase [Butyrivibrio sp. NC2007]